LFLAADNKRKPKKGQVSDPMIDREAHIEALFRIAPSADTVRERLMPVSWSSRREEEEL
jgi:hypothetical protein